MGGDKKLAPSMDGALVPAWFVRGLIEEGERVTYLDSEEEKDVETIKADLLETVRETGPRIT